MNLFSATTSLALACSCVSAGAAEALVGAEADAGAAAKAAAGSFTFCSKLAGLLGVEGWPWGGESEVMEVDRKARARGE